MTKEKETVKETDESPQPMVITRLVRQEDGGVKFSLELTQPQTSILLEFAIATLLGQGLISFVDMLQEQAAKAAQSSTTEDNTPKEERVKITLGEQLH